MIRLFRHYVPGSLLLLGVAEFAALMASVYVGAGAELKLLGGGSAHGLALDTLLPRAFIFAVVMYSAMTAMGLYWRQLRAGSIWNIAVRVIAAFLLGLVALSLIFYVVPDMFIGRGALGFALLIALAGVLGARVTHYTLSDHEALKARVMVVGTGRKAAQLETLRRKVDWRGFKLIGYVHVYGTHDEVSEDKILDRDKPLLEVVREHQIDELIVAIDDRRKYFPIDDILDCKMNGVDVIDLAEFFERQSGKIKLDALHPSSMIFSDGFSNAVLKNYRKTAFDMAVSLLLLLVVWPFMAATALAIWLEAGGRGPIFYRQERVGRNGARFQVLKFRSMCTNAEQQGAQWAQRKDARVTRVGRIIRKYRIDELPQLLNVLKGEMSFVGPRPERPEFVEELASEIPFYNLRHKVSPGITGWAQISYPYGSSVEDAVEKLQYDLYYIKNYSILFDLMILFQTAHAVLWGQGAR